MCRPNKERFFEPTVIRRYLYNSYYMLRGPDVQAGGMATGLILVTTTLACTLPSFQVPRLCGVVDGVRTQTREPSGQAGERVLPLVTSASELTTAPTLHVEYNTMQYNFICKCQYNCTRNMLWCQVHSSHIHSNHKTLNYNNSK